MKKTLSWIAALILFIELLDTTILSSCLVPVAASFHVHSARMSLPILAYIVGTCIFIPIAAWLSNRYNKIHLIVATLILFSLFSFLCGISFDLYSFSLFRLCQGIAISICSAIIIMALLSTCRSNEIVKTMGAINIPALAGSAIGPCVGAIFSYYLSWRMAFFINVPVCLVLVTQLMPLRSVFSVCTMTKQPLDYMGLTLLSTSLIMISAGLEQLSHHINKINLFTILIGILLILSYVFMWKHRETSRENNKIPSILDLHVFKNYDFLFGTVINIMARSAMCGLPILLSIVLQQAYLFSVIQAGWYLAIIAVAGIVAKFLSPLITKFGIHKSVILSATLTAIAIGLLSQLEFLILHQWLWIICFFFGFTMSLLYTAMNSILYISINHAAIPNASNIGKIIQQFSIGLGIVVAVGGFQWLLTTHGIQILSPHNIQIKHMYNIICYILFGLMMLTVLSAGLFYTKQYKLNSSASLGSGVLAE